MCFVSGVPGLSDRGVRTAWSPRTVTGQTPLPCFPGLLEFQGKLSKEELGSVVLSLSCYFQKDGFPVCPGSGRASSPAPLVQARNNLRGQVL